MEFIFALILLMIAAACASIYSRRQAAAHRERKRTLAELAALPAVKMDFSTPEGAILCLENTYPQREIEAAVACRDFETEARIWFRDRGEASYETDKEMLSAVTKSMEKSLRNSMAQQPPNYYKGARSYFLKREPYAQGIVAVNEVTVGPDGSLFRQWVLVAETPNGWRVVTTRPDDPKVVTQ